MSSTVILSKLAAAQSTQSLPSVVVDMTPDLAAEILETNSNNRAVSTQTVAQYAKDMSNGHWRLNGESVVIDKNGNLLDGQHRLWAVFESGKNIPMHVVTGVDPDYFSSIDRGRARTFGHVLGIKGEKQYNQLAAACRAIWQYRNGGFINNTGKPTHDDLQGTLDNESGDIRASLEFCTSKRKPNVMTVANATFFHHVFAQKSQADADRFIEKLYSGADLDAKSPILHLRNRLQENHTGRKKLPKTSVAWLVFRAWNAFRKGQKMGRLLLPGKGTRLVLPDPA